MRHETGRIQMRQVFSSERHRWAGASATALAFALLQARPALAQAADDANNPPAQASYQDSVDIASAVIGTGTNISGVKAVGSEASTIDRADIQATGMTSAS